MFVKDVARSILPVCEPLSLHFRALLDCEASRHCTCPSPSIFSQISNLLVCYLSGGTYFLQSHSCSIPFAFGTALMFSFAIRNQPIDELESVCEARYCIDPISKCLELVPITLEQQWYFTTVISSVFPALISKKSKEPNTKRDPAEYYYCLPLEFAKFLRTLRDPKLEERHSKVIAKIKYTKSFWNQFSTTCLLPILALPLG